MTATATHHPRCPSLAIGGASGPCICISGRPFPARTVPTTPVSRAVETVTHMDVSRARGLAAANSRPTAAGILRERGLSWNTVRLWCRANGFTAAHTKPGRPSMKCVDAYLAAHPTEETP